MERTERALTTLVNFQRTWRTTPSSPGAGEKEEVGYIKTQENREMAKWAKVLMSTNIKLRKVGSTEKGPTTKADDPSLILRTHMGGEDRILKVVL